MGGAWERGYLLHVAPLYHYDERGGGGVKEALNGKYKTKYMKTCTFWLFKFMFKIYIVHESTKTCTFSCNFSI